MNCVVSGHGHGCRRIKGETKRKESGIRKAGHTRARRRRLTRIPLRPCHRQRFELKQETTSEGTKTLRTQQTILPRQQLQHQDHTIKHSANALARKSEYAQYCQWLGTKVIHDESKIGPPPSWHCVSPTARHSLAVGSPPGCRNLEPVL